MIRRTVMRGGGVVLGVALAGPSVALAEAAIGEGPMRLDFWQAGFTLVVFALLLIVLRAVAWKPMLKALQDREHFIRDSIETARRDRADAEKLLKDYQAQIEQSRREASAIVEEGRRDAEVLRRKVQDEARQEGDAILDRARREIQIARDTAVKDLYTLSGNLATQLASKILRRELDASAHEQLISESIEQIADMEHRN